MDISTVSQNLENDFFRHLEVRGSKQTRMLYKGEQRNVLEIDTFLLPRFGEGSYKTFVFPTKINYECLCIDYVDYEKATEEVMEYLE
jgi:hypothetical protein